MTLDERFPNVDEVTLTTNVGYSIAYNCATCGALVLNERDFLSRHHEWHLAQEQPPKCKCGHQKAAHDGNSEFMCLHTLDGKDFCHCNAYEPQE